MFNEVENRSVEAIITRQNVITLKDFEDAYKNRQKENIAVIEDFSLNGESILAIKKDEKTVYLNSQYNADEASEVWAKQFEEQITDNSIVLIFGLGDGTYIQKLLSNNLKSMIIVYEPCTEVFWKVFGRKEIADLLENERVSVSIEGICEGLFSIYLETFINYANYQLIMTSELPNYRYLFLDKYCWYMDKYLFAVKRVIFSRNTEICFSKEMISNILKLSKDVIEQYSIVQLYDIVKRKNLEAMPAVLISAGPSLDKNIDKLKQLENKVFVMAVDTALNTVLKHEIIPDMTITVDGHKPLILFEDERVKKIPVAVSILSNAKVITTSESMRFYELSPEEYLGAMFNEIGRPVEGLPTGGSVANNALALLVKMGFKTIVFMGQDLAYPGGIQHTFDAYHKEDKLLEEKTYFEVDDIYGNKVLTEANMQLYLKWFEMYIAVNPQTRFIDATEGGAFIHGTEILTLDEVICEFKNNTFDKQQIWEGLSPYLNEEEQVTIKGKIKDIPNHLLEVEEYIKKGLRIYYKMDIVNRKSSGKSNSLERMLKDIIELNEYLDNDPILYLVKYYAIQTDYEIKGKVLNFSDKSSMYIQIKELIENGQTLLKGYLDGISDFRKDLDAFLMEFN